MDEMLSNASIRNREVLKPLVWCYKLIGVNVGSEVKGRDPLKIVAVLITILCLLGLWAQYNFIWTHRHEPMLFYMDAICTLLQCLTGLTELLHSIVLQSKFFRLLQTVQNSQVLQNLDIFQLDISNPHRIIADIKNILTESWMNTKKQLHVFTVSLCCVVSWYYISSLALTIYKTYIRPQEFNLIYPFPARFPTWDGKGIIFPFYFIEYLIVGAELYISGLGSLLFVGTNLVFTVHGIALLRVFYKLLSYASMDEYVPQEERVNYMKACIRLHQKIYEYCDALRSLYKMETLPYFLFSMFVKCCLIFQASLVVDSSFDLILKVLLYYASLTTGVGIFCINGQRLKTESELAPNVIYDCAWYQENSDYKISILMMILRSNRCIEMTIGGFAGISLITFLSIVRSSWSYFLILRNVNEAN